jgi:hypothetical protein
MTTPKYKTLTYRRWKSMLQRTRAPETSHQHKHYAAKGVSVCDRWLVFASFLEDMGECPGPTLTLDRIENSKGYEPGNCRWATTAEQNANRSNCVMLTHEGITLNATEWALKLGMRPGTLLMRLSLGWTHERAITTPVKPWGNRRANHG